MLQYSFRNNSTNKILILDLPNFILEVVILSGKKERIKFEIDQMEKEILYYKGKKRLRAKRAYHRLLQTCGSTCELDKPIYIKRSE